MDVPQHFPVEVTRDDLLPSAQMQYDRLIAKAGRVLPIRVTGMNAMQTSAMPLSIEEDDLAGPFIEATDDSIRWSEAYVQKWHVPTDAEVAKLYKPYTNQKAIKALEAIALSLGIKPLPKLISDIGGDGSFESKEGNYYIGIDPKLSTQKAIAAGIHELGHIAHGDSKASAIAALHNSDSNDGYRVTEYNADALVADYCRAGDLASVMRGWLPGFSRQARENHVTITEAMDVLDPHHPRIPDRIHALETREDANKKKGLCK